MAPAPFDCVVCGGNRARSIWVLPDRFYKLPGRFEVAVCARCESTRILNPPAELSVYYPEDYYAASGQPYQPSARRVQVHAALRRTHLGRLFLNTLGARYNKPDVTLATEQQGRIIDIGCGGGWVLDFYRANGWETWGLDIGSGIQAAAERGHKTIVGDVFDADVSPGGFDLVRGSHVVEHVEDPIAFVEKVSPWVAPGGHLLLDLPNTASLLSRIMRRAYWQLDPPRHLAIPSPGPLASAIEAQGLEVDQIITYSRPSGWAKSLYLALQQLGLRGLKGWRMSSQKSRAYRALTVACTPLAVLADAIRMGDSIYILASKPVKPPHGG
jgi:SAM-dependent methyltransferase